MWIRSIEKNPKGAIASIGLVALLKVRGILVNATFH